MAEVYSVTTGIGTPIALAAATAKSVLSIITASTQTARIVQASISFDASTAAAGIKVEVVRFTTDGTGTAYTPLKYNGEAQNRAALCTAKTNYTVEPTTPTAVEAWYVPNTAGQFWQLPLGRELYCPVSTITTIRVTSAAIVNCASSALFEE